MEIFDYIVIGGGSGGCTIASRLSENKANKVCLIEAGGDGKNVLIRMPSAIAAILPTPIFNWAFKTIPQPGLNGRLSYQPRGRALGGSSAINAMLYIRGHKSDYDEWRDLGNPGWGYDDVLPYFIKSEGNQRGGDEFHGADGPLSVSDQVSPHEISSAFLQAGRETQYTITDDFNGAEQEGLGFYQVTQKNGERCSAAAAYIHPHMERPNLTVLTKTRAHKIIVKDGRAAGVKISGAGGSRTITSNKEIILAGGAFASPQLLMLSGIGPAKHLKELGIDVVADRPQVGQNLQDHIDYVTAYKSERKDVFGISLSGGRDILRGIFDWRNKRSGKLTTPFAETGGFFKSDKNLNRPDMQYHFVTGIVDDHNRKTHFGHGFSCHVCLLHPKSRGSVMLASSDVTKAPLIDMGFYSQDQDLKTMVKGFKAMRQLLNAPALAPWRGEELYTANIESDAEIEGILRQRSDTVYHPVGTCRMGADADAVVDPQLRVNGVAGLRVSDASIMPRIISGNTNAPTIMIAEKCADMIQNRQ